jgi:hypothetical protein
MACDGLEIILHCHEIALLELSAGRRRRVRLVIVHKYAYANRCTPGEECSSIWLLWGGRQYQIPLSVTHLLLVDFLCHQSLGKSATEIADGLTEPFYAHHGSNGPRHVAKPARTGRVAVRKQIQRVREVMTDFFSENEIDLDPYDIIRTEPTSTLEVKYRVHAAITWDHPEWNGSAERPPCDLVRRDRNYHVS